MEWRKVAKHLKAGKLLIFDFDGVFTDNRVWVQQDGTELVACNRSDGLGIKLLEALNLPTMILSKEKNPVVLARANKLKIPCAHGIDNKKDYLVSHLAKSNLKWSELLYVGNDVNDVAVMNEVGFSMAVRDAFPEAKRAADFILKNSGGRGAVREVCELVARAKLKLTPGQSPWERLKLI